MLSNKKLFLFDIDGTVCQGERLIDGTMQFLEDIRQSGGQFVFITNNSTKSIQDIVLNALCGIVCYKDKQFHKEHSGLYLEVSKAWN